MNATTKNSKNLLIYGLLTLTILLGSLTQSTAQYGMEVSPRLSHAKGTYYKIGYTEINIRYSGPSVKNRKIWGDLVPFDKVWRAGANNATTIEFNYPVEINGQSLAAGKYGFFIIPIEHGRWTLIFNSVHDQWGVLTMTKVKMYYEWRRYLLKPPSPKNSPIL